MKLEIEPFDIPEIGRPFDLPEGCGKVLTRDYGFSIFFDEARSRMVFRAKINPNRYGNLKKVHESLIDKDHMKNILGGGSLRCFERSGEFTGQFFGVYTPDSLVREFGKIIVKNYGEKLEIDESYVSMALPDNPESFVVQRANWLRLGYDFCEVPEGQFDDSWF